MRLQLTLACNKTISNEHNYIVGISCLPCDMSSAHSTLPNTGTRSLLLSLFFSQTLSISPSFFSPIFIFLSSFLFLPLTLSRSNSLSLFLFLFLSLSLSPPPHNLSLFLFSCKLSSPLLSFYFSFSLVLSLTIPTPLSLSLLFSFSLYVAISNSFPPSYTSLSVSLNRSIFP